MLTLAEFQQLASAVGEPVVFHQTKAPQAVVNIPRAIVQDMGKKDEVLINSYGVTGKTVQIAANLLPAPPEKFDYIMRGAEKLVFENVNIEHSRQTGAVTYYVCFVKGK